MTGRFGASDRGQANVVGVALLLGITVVSLGVLTAGVGSVVEEEASRVDARRVAAAMDDALQPAARTGPATGRLSFAGGTLRVEERTLRVFAGEPRSLAAEREVRALVFTAGDRRAAFVAGAVVRGSAGNAAVVGEPPFANGDGVLLVGSAELGSAAGGAVGSAATGAPGGATTVRLRTNTTHDRRALGEGRYSVAIETETPEAWARYFRSRGATVRESEFEDFDNDGVVSVVAEYPGRRTAYLVVHRLRLRVEVVGA
ncbi:MAG: hypothetical protein ABEJ79_11395 [Halolamina sp.]